MPPRQYGASGKRIWHCMLYRSAVQVLATATVEPILFDTALANYGNMWSPGDPGKVRIPFLGLWDLTGVVRYDTASATGIRQTFFRRTRDGATRNFSLSDCSGSTANNQTYPIALTMVLQQGDIIELIGFQSSGGNLNSNNFAYLAPLLTVTLRERL